MEQLLKGFSVSFLLRSVFAGAFFVISYFAAFGIEHALLTSDVPGIAGLGLAGLVAGVICYGLHRSLTYPFVELFFDSDWGTRFRIKFPLITRRSRELILGRWDRQASDCAKLGPERARNMTVWADFSQLQYTSAVCIFFGAAAGVWLDSPNRHSLSVPMAVLFTLFSVAAFISDWRLRSVLDYMQERERAERDRSQTVRATQDRQ